MAMSKPVISQFQDVIRCSVCEQEVGQLHCDTCQVYICKICAGTHITSDLSQQHLIVECSKRSTIKLDVCKTHLNQRCDIHCQECDIPVCSKCMASSHAKHEVKDILEFCKSRQDEIRQDNYEIQNCKLIKLEQACSELNTLIDELPAKFDEISIDIEKHGTEWHKQVDIIIKEFTEDVEKMKKTALSTLKGHYMELETLISLSREILQQNIASLQSSEAQVLAEYKSKLHEIQESSQDIEVNLPKFDPLELNVENIRKSFGALEPRVALLSLNRKSEDKAGETVSHECDWQEDLQYMPMVKCAFCKRVRAESSYCCTICDRVELICPSCLQQCKT